jgi:hypothetical protein
MWKKPQPCLSINFFFSEECLLRLLTGFIASYPLGMMVAIVVLTAVFAKGVKGHLTIDF